ncbi:MAG: hypothetical protein ACRCXA_09905, partial [Peptostreptococcaceae bacterium]
MNDYINYIGINEDLPTNIKYFKEELIDNVFFKSEDANPIEKIISSSIDLRVKSIKLLNTSVRTSNEGKKLSGKKLLVELNIQYSIKYTSNSLEKYLYVLKNNITKIMYIVVPKEIDEVNIEDFIRRKKIQVQSFVEDLYVQRRNENSVYIRTLLLLNANIK